MRGINPKGGKQWLDCIDEFSDVYSREGREELVEDDEISAEEDLFMQGWDEAA